MTSSVWKVDLGEREFERRIDDSDQCIKAVQLGIGLGLGLPGAAHEQCQKQQEFR